MHVAREIENIRFRFSFEIVFFYFEFHIFQNFFNQRNKQAKALINLRLKDVSEYMWK